MDIEKKRDTKAINNLQVLPYESQLILACKTLLDFLTKISCFIPFFVHFGRLHVQHRLDSAGPTSKEKYCFCALALKIPMAQMYSIWGTRQPPWRNGLACWTSNSKVVGSSPTGGGIFDLKRHLFKS